jgi:hypothetical protein
MPTDPVRYIRIAEGEPLPELKPYAPYRAVVVLGGDYSSEWQDKVSDWLVRSGCLYMMAWGPDCSSWDDSVDWANLRDFDFGDIPDDRFVLTTWHEHESLEDVFWFAGFCASHGTVELRNTVIIHVSARDEGEKMLERFQDAQHLHD